MNQYKNIAAIGFIILLLGFDLMLLPLQGTNDIYIWLRWMGNLGTDGLIQGFANNQADYPPLCSLILWLTHRVGHTLGYTDFAALKFCLYIFLWTSCAITWAHSKNFWLVILLHFSILLNSLCLGYLDVFYVPTLLLAFIYLRQERWMFFSVCYAAACLTKWQPVILAPWFAVYIVNTSNIAGSYVWTGFRRVTIPGLFVGGAVVSLFGIIPVLKSFKLALTHQFLSANALNINWVGTYFLHKYLPQDFGPLVNGRITYIEVAPLWITLLSKSAFIGALGYWLWRCASVVKIESMIKCMLLGYFSYFIFNTGVHENHLFTLIILVVVLLLNARAEFWSLSPLIILANLNLVLFYGFDGRGSPFDRTLGGLLDVTFVAAIAAVAYYCWLTFLSRQRLSALTTANPISANRS